MGYNLWGHKESDTVVATYHALLSRGFPGGSVVKNPPANAGDLDSMPELGGSPGEGNGNPLQYSCLENSMDGGAWWATVHGVAKSQTRLSNFIFFLSFLYHLSHLGSHVRVE